MCVRATVPIGGIDAGGITPVPYGVDFALGRVEPWVGLGANLSGVVRLAGMMMELE